MFAASTIGDIEGGGRSSIRNRWKGYVKQEVSAMSRITGNIVPVENIGLVDRIVRFVAGCALMGFGVYSALTTSHDAVSATAILLAVYPLLTAMLGWDPLYNLIGGRTCSLGAGRNQCGTLPYEVDAALGHNPHPGEGYEYDHSLVGSHH
jgi:hypothetical protein